MKKGTIIYIDDDEDDGIIFSEVYESIQQKNGSNSELLIFSSGKSLLQYLNENKLDVVLIISDINMPEMNGYQLKEAVNQTDYAITPYVLYSTATPADSAKPLMSHLNIGGFYLKQASYNDMALQLQGILSHWHITAEV